MKLGMKLFAIGLMTLVIVIALFSVSSVIGDREQYRKDAAKSIADSYSGPQRIAGPVLIRPYTQTVEDVVTDDKGMKKKTSRKVEGSDVLFPDTFTMQATVVPSKRRHSLYKVPVYEMHGHLTGDVEIKDQPKEGVVVYGTPYFALSLSDVRGIVGTPKMLVNGTPTPIFQGSGDLKGLSTNLRVPLVSASGNKFNFDLDLVLAGTEELSIAPVGDSNNIEWKSSWASPLFSGRFLPRTREIGPQGFTAAWDISSLASQTQTQMTQSDSKGLDVLSVELTTVVDPYTLSDRAVKYGFLFVLLTFGGFFVFETMKQMPIHPVQYLLVGFGLTIFFLLLISLSEHMAFTAAYLVASAACIGLLTFYLSYVLRSITRGLAFGAMLTALYGCIYGLLISEDNALVLGSLMLFAVLSGVMVVTRKVDWYQSGWSKPGGGEKLKVL